MCAVIFRLLGTKKKSRAEHRHDATSKFSKGKVPVKAKLDTSGMDAEVVQKEMDRAKKLGIKVGKTSVVPGGDSLMDTEKGVSPRVRK